MPGFWKKNKSTVGYLNYQGAIPSILYRYRSIDESNLERTITEIAAEEIWLSGLIEVNDIQEGAVEFIVDGDETRIKRLWSEVLQSQRTYHDPLAYARDVDFYTKRTLLNAPAVPEEFSSLYRRVLVERAIRVACFTEDAFNAAMWTHYSKYKSKDGRSADAGGLVIGYSGLIDIAQELNLAPIVYDDSILKINPLSVSESDLVKTFYRKSKNWSYEREWRISQVLELHSEDDVKVGYDRNSKIRLKNSILSVYFGWNAPSPLRDHIRNEVRRGGKTLDFKVLGHDGLSRRMVLSDF